METINLTVQIYGDELADISTKEVGADSVVVTSWGRQGEDVFPVALTLSSASRSDTLQIHTVTSIAVLMAS